MGNVIPCLFFAFISFGHSKQPKSLAFTTIGSNAKPVSPM